MLVTDKEARKKICPLLNVPFQTPAYCQGSKCMFWRWSNRPGEEKEPKGYCGLAGKPEFY